MQLFILSRDCVHEERTLRRRKGGREYPNSQPGGYSVCLVKTIDSLTIWSYLPNDEPWLDDRSKAKQLRDTAVAKTTRSSGQMNIRLKIIFVFVYMFLYIYVGLIWFPVRDSCLSLSLIGDHI